MSSRHIGFLHTRVELPLMLTFFFRARFSQSSCRSILLAFILTLMASVGQAQTPPSASDPSLQNLAKQIDAFLDVPGLQAGFQGVCIQSLKDNTVLYERNADKVFLPASNNKLLTSAAALALLGPNYVYHTRLYGTRAVDRHGVLHGDLILRGAGDPLLSPTQLNALAHAVYLKGVRRITGHLRYDDSFFDRQRLGDGWTWDDEPFYYSAQVSALNLNENILQVQVLPGSHPGTPCRVLVGPTDTYVKIVNHALTVAPAHGKSPARNDKPLVPLNITRLRGENTLLVTGTLPVDVTSKDNLPTGVTVEDPSRYTAQAFAQDLIKAGIRLRYPEVKDGPPLPALATLVAEHKSPPLSEMLRLLNKPSDNLMAECLLKTVGAEKTGQGTAGLSGSGARITRTFLQSIGLSLGELQQADGSGLSRLNYVSPRNLVRLLAYMHTRPDFPVYYGSLPIAGVDGTLRRRMKNTPAQGNCHAKTGSLSHVSACSGYVTTKDGEMLVFSLMMNHQLAPGSAATGAQDKIVALLAGYQRHLASAVSSPAAPH